MAAAADTDAARQLQLQKEVERAELSQWQKENVGWLMVSNFAILAVANWFLWSESEKDATSCFHGSGSKTVSLTTLVAFSGGMLALANTFLKEVVLAMGVQRERLSQGHLAKLGVIFISVLLGCVMMLLYTYVPNYPVFVLLSITYTIFLVNFAFGTYVVMWPPGPDDAMRPFFSGAILTGFSWEIGFCSTFFQWCTASDDPEAAVSHIGWPDWRLVVVIFSPIASVVFLGLAKLVSMLLIGCLRWCWALGGAISKQCRRSGRVDVEPAADARKLRFDETFNEVRAHLWQAVLERDSVVQYANAHREDLLDAVCALYGVMLVPHHEHVMAVDPPLTAAPLPPALSGPLSGPSGPQVNRTPSKATSSPSASAHDSPLSPEVSHSSKLSRRGAGAGVGAANPAIDPPLSLPETEHEASR